MRGESHEKCFACLLVGAEMHFFMIKKLIKKHFFIISLGKRLQIN
jgi:hypothetical protein